MMTSQENAHAMLTIRIAPWVCGIATAAAALVCIWVRAPLAYLLWSAGFGIAWFVLMVLSWRARSGVVHFFTLLLAISGHMILRERLMHGQYLGMFQGLLVSIVFLSGLLMLLRCWVIPFARLERDDQDDHAT